MSFKAGNLTERKLVRDALESCANGSDHSKYMKLLDELKECEDTIRLVALLNSIAEWASVIGEHHERFKELLVMLFSFDWDIADEAVMGAFENVLVSLVSANGGFLDEAFRLLVRNFSRDDENDEGLEQIENDGEGAAPEIIETETQKLIRIRLGHLHDTIQRILSICPLGCSTLLNVILECFPKQHQEVKVHCDFAREALKVGERVPVLQDRVLRMAIKSLLELDLDLATTVEEARQQGLQFKMEDMVVEGEEEDESRTKRLRVHESDLEVAEKVDSLLCILFRFADDHVAKKKSTALLFRAALESFEKDVLRTGKAKFTQFYIFYLCSLKATYVDSFTALLFGRVEDEKEHMIVRENAAKFLGSFLARAKYVQPRQVKSCLERMNVWLQSQLATVSSSSSKHKKRRSLFMAVFQSVIYIALFKGSQLGGIDTLNSLPGWRDLCENSAFKPLGRLSSDISEEFASFAGRQFSTASVLQGSTMLNDEEDEPPLVETKQPQIVIEVDFPFDPLGLEKSSKMIEHLYQEWYSSEIAEDASEGGGDFTEDDADEEPEGHIELDYDILNAEVPKPIKIDRIRKMLGGAWITGGENNIFPSPGLRPTPPPHSLAMAAAGKGMLLSGNYGIPIPKAGQLATSVGGRPRSYSGMSTESGLAGSW